MLPRASRAGRGGTGRGDVLPAEAGLPLPPSPSCRGDPTSLTLVFSCKLHGAAYGKGIYLSPISSISFGYSGKRLPALPGPACAPTPAPCMGPGGAVREWAAPRITPHILPTSSQPGQGFPMRQGIKTPKFSRLQKLLCPLLGVPSVQPPGGSTQCSCPHLWHVSPRHPRGAPCLGVTAAASLLHRDGERAAPDAVEGRAGAEVQPDEHHPPGDGPGDTVGGWGQECGAHGCWGWSE